MTMWPGVLMLFWVTNSPELRTEVLQFLNLMPEWSRLVYSSNDWASSNHEQHLGFYFTFVPLDMLHLLPKMSFGQVVLLRMLLRDLCPRERCHCTSCLGANQI